MPTINLNNQLPAAPCVLVNLDTGTVVSTHPDLSSAIAAARRLIADHYISGEPHMATTIQPASVRALA
jgi:hypothetical protein